jgi:hypothetical protein
MNPTLRLIVLFLVLVVVLAAYLGVMSSPFLSSLNWGMIVTITIIICVIALIVWAIGLRNFGLTVLVVMILLLVVTVWSAASSQSKVNAEKRIAEIHAQATATAIEQWKESQIPPGHVRVFTPPEFVGPFVWGIVFVAAGLLLSNFLRKVPKSVILMVATLGLALFLKEGITWGTTLMVSMVLMGIGRILRSGFGVVMGLVTYFISWYAGVVLGGLLSAIIFGLGATQVWTIVLLMPRNPEQWIVAGFTTVCPFILYGFWNAPPE